MTYKHGNWCCKPANEAEAREIVERAVASGAENPSKMFWAVGDGFTDETAAIQAAFYASVSIEHETEYTIEQVREKFPLPGERVEDEQEWNGGGFPPVGVECEFYRADIERWVGCTTIGMFHNEMVCATDGGGFFAGKAENIRPLRSERERWVEVAEAATKIIGATSAIGLIYDAIKSGELKAPEVE